MIVHLIDGTYELFRHFYGARRGNNGADSRFGGLRGVLHGVLEIIEKGGTHLGVATDHVIESFRNDLWSGYKTGFGIDPLLWAQFHPLEEGLAAMGVVVWPMVELEADDALASAAWIARQDDTVEKICIWTPDKDLAQCVSGSRVVQIDGRRGQIRDEAGVEAKYGVRPESIADYLALVGDTADGYPGLEGFGAKSSAAILRRFTHTRFCSRNSRRCEPTRRCSARQPSCSGPDRLHRSRNSRRTSARPSSPRARNARGTR
jgi:5'-3' exonuclease